MSANSIAQLKLRIGGKLTDSLLFVLVAEGNQNDEITSQAEPPKLKILIVIFLNDVFNSSRWFILGVANEKAFKKELKKFCQSFLSIAFVIPYQTLVQPHLTAYGSPCYTRFRA